MIEITCTKTEKTRIIDALVHSGFPCLFPRKSAFCSLGRRLDCKDCLEKKIRWNVRVPAGRGVAPATGPKAREKA